MAGAWARPYAEFDMLPLLVHSPSAAPAGPRCKKRSAQPLTAADRSKAAYDDDDDSAEQTPRVWTDKTPILPILARCGYECSVVAPYLVAKTEPGHEIDTARLLVCEIEIRRAPRRVT